MIRTNTANNLNGFFMTISLLVQEKEKPPLEFYSHTSIASLSIAQGASEASDASTSYKERAKRVTLCFSFFKEGVGIFEGGYPDDGFSKSQTGYTPYLTHGF